jgi:hypothetical protein
MTDQAPFRVLGIALVVEERGKGARLVFRYPAVPECDADNLFFTLPPRTIAKIFRPKKPLSNQPMTISLGGTVFCCRAVLMSAEHLKDSSALVLFSVIVSLIPSVHTSAIPISGWYERDITDLAGAGSPQARMQRKGEDAETRSKRVHLKPSTSFLALRKIHVSLARLCRVLEREEQRCRYVSLQSVQLQKIAEDFKALKANTISASTSEIGKRRHRRTMTAGSVGGPAIFTEMAMDRDDTEEEMLERQERDQEVMDLMLAAKFDGSQIHGNLARELLQVFHAMSRTNQSSAPISSAILSARDCTVFVNRHIAVPIDSVAHDLVQEVNPVVRTYQTLLFPRVIAVELANSFTSSNSRMKQFLYMLDAAKSLSELSSEAALSLASVVEMATYMVSNGACVTSHVFSKKSTLACCADAISRMNELTLQFSQLFRHLSIHCVVSLLTMGCTMEELIERLSIEDRIDVELLGGALQQLIADVQETREEEKSKSRQKAQDEKEKQLEYDLAQDLGLGSLSLGNGGGNVPHKEQQAEDDSTNPSVAAISALEGYLMAMAAWLGAHKILIPKQEYLVAGNFGFDSKSLLAVANKGAGSSDEESFDGSRAFEESLCKELVQGGCLNGKISSVAMCWRFGLDKHALSRIRSWGRKAGKITSVWRVPNLDDDDWGNSESG